MPVACAVRTSLRRNVAIRPRLARMGFSKAAGQVIPRRASRPEFHQPPALFALVAAASCLIRVSYRGYHTRFLLFCKGFCENFPDCSTGSGLRSAAAVIPLRFILMPPCLCVSCPSHPHRSWLARMKKVFCHSCSCTMRHSPLYSPMTDTCWPPRTCVTVPPPPR